MEYIITPNQKMEDFSHKLDSLFQKQNLNEMFDLNPETAVLSDEEMNKMLDRGQATRDITAGGNMVKNSDFLAQIGNHIYVKTKNPRYTDESDKYVWIINRNRHNKTKRLGTGSNYLT